MAEALNEVYLGENNLEKMRKAAAGAKQTLKMKDGSIGVDSFTASAIMQIYDKINDKNKKTMENLLKDGKKADIVKLMKFAMSKVNAEYVPEEFEEEFELDEAKYDLYHKDFSSAMQHAYKMAKKMYGITVDPKEIDDKVASGPKKPSEGKTNSYRLEGDKGAIQVQVYNKGGSKPFELNMYKEEVELDEAVRLKLEMDPEEEDRWVLRNGKKFVASGYKDAGKYFAVDNKLAGDRFFRNKKQLIDFFQTNMNEEVELDETTKFSNADFMLGFLVPWAMNPTTKYEPHLVNYVKKLIPANNREYAYSMIAQQLTKLIQGGMPAVKNFARQNKGAYDKMDKNVKKHLMKGMKEEAEEAALFELSDE